MSSTLASDRHKFVERLVGPAMETELNFNGDMTVGLVDSGSVVTTLANHFYSSMEDKPVLHQLKDLELVVNVADGNSLPYLGYIEVEIGIPSINDSNRKIPCLVVPDTEYNAKVPVIIGTNYVRYIMDTCDVSGCDTPGPWKVAFGTLAANCKSVGTVKATNRKTLSIQPQESVIVSGMVRKGDLTCTAVTEQGTGLSGSLTVCPRVVSLNASTKTVRVPVKICNISAKVLQIQPRAKLCELQDVKVLRSWSPDEVRPSTEQGETTPKETTEDIDKKLEDLGLKLEGSCLSKEHQGRLKDMLNNWTHIFSKGTTDLGCTDLTEHEIKLTDEKPFKEPYRRIPPGMYEEVREHLKEMVEAGAIRPSQSPYSSNIVLVRKRDHSLRFCIDFRTLNSKTIRDAYSLPRIDETLDALSGSKIYSKLDLRAGYWQVPVKESDKFKTAFSVGPLGFWECNRMAFGLTNAPSTFQRLMERCMGDLHLRDCLIYLDDVIIFSKDFEEHCTKLEAVFRRLEQHGLKLKGSKCEFCKDRVQYLGHIVSHEGVETDPEKCAALKNWPVPTNIKDVRRFLGFAGYYRRFVKDYSKLVRPLNNLLVGHPTNKKSKNRTKKSTPWTWTEEQQSAFELIIEKLTSPPILAYADYKKPFIINTDASSHGLGAVLYQEQDGKERVIAYASRSLHNGEKNYPPHKLEFLALKWAVTDKFHDFLYGNKFTVRTDNNPLTYVLKSAKLDATGHRWIAALSNFDFNIVYRSGQNNGDADALSRLPCHQKQKSEVFTEAVKAICHAVLRKETPLIECNALLPAEDPEGFLPADETTFFDAPDWSKEQSEDPDIGRVKTFLQKKTRPTQQQLSQESQDVRKILSHWDKLVLKNNIVYRKIQQQDETVHQLLLPTAYKDLVFQALHTDMGHQGRDRVTSLMKARFYWPGMDKEVSDRIQSCENCIKRKSKTSNRTAGLVNISTTTPLELLCIDYLGLERSKGGYENILVITDHFTRIAHAIPTKDQKAHTTAKALYESFFQYYGFPSKLHSDQGRNFESAVIAELCKMAGVKKTRTTPFHPMGNGMTERFNYTLCNMLGTLKEHEKEDWKTYVAPMVHAYNCTRHESTGYSPFYLMFLRHPRLVLVAFLGLQEPDSHMKNQNGYVGKLKQRMDFAYKRAAEESQKQQNRHKIIYDLKVRETKLEPGDRVLVKNTYFNKKNKLADRWLKEPYIIQSQPNPEIPVYVVKKEHGIQEKVLHRNLLLPINFIPSAQQPTRANTDQWRNLRNKKARTRRAAETESETESTASDSSDGIYVVPQRRRGSNGKLRARTALNPEAPEFLPDSILTDSNQHPTALDVSAGLGNESYRNYPLDQPTEIQTPDASVDQSAARQSPEISVERSEVQSPVHENSAQDLEENEEPQPVRRSSRERRPPKWFTTGDWHM